MLILVLSFQEVKDYSNDFNSQIAKHRYAFVKFYSPNCPACSRMKETFTKFEESSFVQQQNIAIVEVNCLAGFDFCREIGIVGWPNVRFYHNGRFINQYRNVHVHEAYVDWLEEQIERVNK